MEIGWSTMNTPLDPTPIELAKAHNLKDRSLEVIRMAQRQGRPRVLFVCRD